MAGKLVTRGTTTDFGVSLLRIFWAQFCFFVFSAYPFFFSSVALTLMFWNWSVPKNNFPLVGKPPLPPAGSVIRSCFQEREQLNAFFLLLLNLHQLPFTTLPSFPLHPLYHLEYLHHFLLLHNPLKCGQGAQVANMRMRCWLMRRLSSQASRRILTLSLLHCRCLLCICARLLF